MSSTPIADQMRAKITAALTPDYFDLVDESHKHVGHAGHDGHGESHFHLTVVAGFFTGLNRVQRQKKIYEILKQEMAGRVHALGMSLKAPGEG